MTDTSAIPTKPTPIPLRPMNAAPPDNPPKDRTIIVSGGWYTHPVTKQRQDGLPAYVAWDEIAGGWVMQDDHRGIYHEPKQWVSA